MCLTTTGYGTIRSVDRYRDKITIECAQPRELPERKTVNLTEPVKDIDLPGSLHTTTNARRYEVAAGVAKTATGIRWMPTASLAAPLLQLRLDPKTGSPRARPDALGPWVGPRHDEVREPRPPVGPAPPAGRQPKALEDWRPRARQQHLIDRLAPQAPRGLVAFYLWATLLQPAIASGRT